MRLSQSDLTFNLSTIIKHIKLEVVLASADFIVINTNVIIISESLIKQAGFFILLYFRNPVYCLQISLKPSIFVHLLFIL